MLTIHKYPFEIKDEFAIEMPAGARIVEVELQGGTPCLWAFVDTDRPMAPRRFRIYGTGHEIDPEASRYVASFQMPPFVWHLFEARN